MLPFGTKNVSIAKSTVTTNINHQVCQQLFSILLSNPLPGNFLSCHYPGKARSSLTPNRLILQLYKPENLPHLCLYHQIGAITVACWSYGHSFHYSPVEKLCSQVSMNTISFILTRLFIREIPHFPCDLGNYLCKTQSLRHF